MFDVLFPMFYLGAYGDSEYYNLTDEEKNNFDFVNECINSDNPRINNAAFYIMMLVLKLSEDPAKYEPEDVHEELVKIKEGLTKEEQTTVDKLLFACIQTLGIYSEEAKQERKLKKERMKNNE